MRNKWKKDIALIKKRIVFYRDSDLQEAFSLLKNNINNSREQKSTIINSIALSFIAIEKVLDKTLFDVQLAGALSLCNGNIVEMKTGEGKTLVAVPAAVYFSLFGKGVHVITVNDYLATSQLEILKPVYDLLGISAMTITENSSAEDRIAAYNTDITYGTNKQFGFDYLRDNMCGVKGTRVQRDLAFAIIDEIDSILIDEAKTPLIIAKKEINNDKAIIKAHEFAKTLIESTSDGNKTKFENLKEEVFKDFHDVDGDFIVDRTFKTVFLTKQGIKKAEAVFDLKHAEDDIVVQYWDYIRNSLYAIHFMTKDKEYIVKDKNIYVVDEYTGRIMKDRHFSNGLHQALEAKEGLTIHADNNISASITIQNYFLLYDYIVGMTGTAITSAKEFKKFYGLEVDVIPTNKPMIRTDHPDYFFNTKDECYEALCKLVVDLNLQGQPVLIGTQSIKESEIIAKKLESEGVGLNLLNAKNPSIEASIVAQAGRPHAVTIATNMAGRGTDILLGGNPELLAKKKALSVMEFGCENPEEEFHRVYDIIYPEIKKKCSEDRELVVSLGGLAVIGVGRNISRRIDNQLIGRSGRQGDIGESCFFVSFEDDLIKTYGNKYNKKMFMKNRRSASYVLKKSQARIENLTFDARNSLFQLDCVNNEHRQYIYELRRQIINSDDVDSIIKKAFSDISKIIFSRIQCGKGFTDENLNELNTFLLEEMKLSDVAIDNSSFENAFTSLRQSLYDLYKEKINAIQANNTDFEKDSFLKNVLLRAIDMKWIEFLTSLDVLKTSTSVSVFGALTPTQAYKLESTQVYDQMIDDIKIYLVSMLTRLSTTKNKFEYKQIKTVVT